VLGKDYNNKCDLWSCGVILYLMVAGYPPFYAESKNEIISLIKNGSVYYSGILSKTTQLEPIWEKVSPECRSLISQLLTYDAEDRTTASAALKSPWIKKFAEATSVSDIDLRISLINLKNFRTQMTLQKAVLTYMASRQLSQKAENKIRKLFDFYDVDKDGQISKNELFAGYKLLYGNTKKAKKEVEHILTHVSLNKNGNIGYNGTFSVG